MDVIIFCVVALALAVVFAKKKALPWILFGVAAVVEALCIFAAATLAANPELAADIASMPASAAGIFAAIFAIIDVVAIIFICKRRKAAKAAEEVEE